MTYPLFKHPISLSALISLTLCISLPVAFISPLQAQEATDQILLQIEGKLEPGDNTLDDGSFYDVHVFEGQAGQTVGITLESLEFDTVLLLENANGERLAANDDFDEYTRQSFVPITLPDDGSYRVLANSYGIQRTGSYRLLVTWSTSAEAQPRLSEEALQQREANRFFQQGFQQYYSSQFMQAIRLWQQALELYSEVGNRVEEGATLNSLGLAYQHLGQYQRAIKHYEQYLSITREISDLFREAKALGNLGNAYDGLSQYQQAIDFHEQALSISREIGDRAGEGRALGNLGNVYVGLGQYQQAIDLHNQSLVIFRELGDPVGEGKSLGNLAVVYSALSQYEKAINFHEQELDIVREIGDRFEEGRTLGNLGATYDNLGQYQKAIYFLEQALVIAREVGDRFGESTRLGNLGLTYVRLGQYQRSIALYEEALAITREINNRDAEAKILGRLGDVYIDLGQYQQAVDLYEKQLLIAREIGDRGGEGSALGRLGVGYDALGQYQQAIDFYEQDLSIAREIGDRVGEATTLGNLAVIYERLRQYQQAIDLYTQQLVITREVGYLAGESLALGNLGNVYLRSGGYEQAAEYYQQALKMFQELDDIPGMGAWLSNIGALLARQKNSELAIIFYKESLNFREIIRSNIQPLSRDLQKSFVETIAQDYRALANLLLQQDRVLEAQEVLDLLKLQELDDLKLQVRGNEETAKGLDLWPAEQEILDRYYQLLQQDPAADFDTFINSPDIQTGIEKLRRNAQGQNLNPAQLEKLQDNLQQVGNAALLYPLVLDDRLELILVTTAGISRHTVEVDRAQLNRTILAFRTDITNTRTNPIPNAQRLYSWLMEPIADDLDQAGVDTILYAADGQLRYIPLAALHDGTQWLTQRYTINHITAASLTDFSRDDTTTDLSILAGAFSDTATTHEFDIGDKEFRFNGLKFAGVEVKTIADEIPNTQALFDQDFSRANVEPDMGNHSIVHFATHAEFVPGFPHESFILFGNGDRVSLRDISDWKLPNTDLVVLSACRTAVSGELGGGEEILGFGYQVQRTGARAAIASLWYVSDGGTQNLMNAFYTALQSGYSETEALRQAQMALITDDYSAVEQGPRGIRIEPLEDGSLSNANASSDENPLSHPYYWAPFILIGNGL